MTCNCEDGETGGDAVRRAAGFETVFLLEIGWLLAGDDLEAVLVLRGMI